MIDPDAPTRSTEETMTLHRYGCTLTDPHDCANVRGANDALRRHLDRACRERDNLRARLAAEVALADGLAETARGVMAAWLRDASEGDGIREEDADTLSTARAALAAHQERRRG